MEWKTVKLGDILKITGGQLYKGDLLGSGDNLLLGMGCVSFLEKFLLKGARQYGGDCLDKNIGHPGDIVLATRQQSDNLPILAMPAIIPEGLPAKKIIIGSNLYKVNVTDPDFNNRFIYWLLKTPEYVNYISSVKTGTTVKMITIKDVESYTFLCPPKESRDKISKFLWNLDDKIENNNRINRNLEAQAQALFKSWFVDFEPWGGTMPEDWKEGHAEEFFTINIGKTPPRKEKEWFTHDYRNCKWVSISDMATCGTFISDSSEYLTQKAVDKFNIVMVPKDSILLSFKLTIGRVAIAQTELTTNEAIARFILPKPIYREYLYLLLKKYNYSQLGSTSSIATAVNSRIIKSMSMVMPTEEVLRMFNTTAKPLFEQIANNQRENTRLAALRDTLLPKLMKGEIEL